MVDDQAVMLFQMRERRGLRALNRAALLRIVEHSLPHRQLRMLARARLGERSKEEHGGSESNHDDHGDEAAKASPPLFRVCYLVIHANRPTLRFPLADGIHDADEREHDRDERQAHGDGQESRHDRLDMIERPVDLGDGVVEERR